MRLIYLLLLSIIIDQPVSPSSSVPILCYHNISADDSRKSSALSISRLQLRAQLKALADSGYHSILPDQLYAYLTTGKKLPDRPVMITFDDTRTEHFTIAAPLLQEYGFKGVFFVMTVPVAKPGYMNASQIKALSDMGHVIGAHTWDHPHAKGIRPSDREKQLVNPRHVLEKITGKPVEYIAYPFGEWNETVIADVQISGYKAAFQLTGKVSPANKLYTIRRIMVNGSWSGPRLQQELKIVFK
ncbi:polysaccharide deacetylase family protein [Chitinophaga filiformis]|uniref:polysaccharide deacetylase family protein n=1 Tax=Chitinophaga filiformis TaxID=104663 RepID=UPI001F1FED2B|nr:polysaccharide deacetylase family protein [Chitinophaga filiformis]MCF6405325.1 polysaccharide deacetylase family protein [Chitinophaga filiformis]